MSAGGAPSRDLFAWARVWSRDRRARRSWPKLISRPQGWPPEIQDHDFAVQAPVRRIARMESGAGNARLHRQLLGLGDDRAAGHELRGRARPLEHLDVCLISIPVVLGALLRIPMGCSPTGRRPARVRDLSSTRRGRRCWSASRRATRRCSAPASCSARRGRLRGRRAVRRRVGGAERQGFALGVYGIGNVGTAVAAFAVPAIRDSAGQEVAGW